MEVEFPPFVELWQSTPVCLIPLSINEIRCLFNRVAVRICHPVEHVMAWSLFRRRSQQRTRASHYRRRTSNNLLLRY